MHTHTCTHTRAHTHITWELYCLALSGLDPSQRPTTGKKKILPFQGLHKVAESTPWNINFTFSAQLAKLFQSSNSQARQTHLGKRGRWVTPSCADKAARTKSLNERTMEQTPFIHSSHQASNTRKIILQLVSRFRRHYLWDQICYHSKRYQRQCRKS